MASIFNVTIHSDASEFPTEKRYDGSITISELKKKLELITGASHTSMSITLSIGDKEVGELAKDDATLAHYVGDQAGKEGVSLKLVVKDSQASHLLSGDVPKFTISEEKYQARQNNARNFIKEMRQKRASGQQEDPQEEEPNAN